MIIYTNAPKDYDYHYVTELDANVGNFNSGMDKDRPVRKLDIDAPEWQVQHQRDRYSSGLYPSLDEGQMVEWISYNFFTPRGGGLEKVTTVLPRAPHPLPDAMCADCNASASVDDVGGICTSCGRGIIIDTKVEDDELDYISGTEPGTWCETEKED